MRLTHKRVHVRGAARPVLRAKVTGYEQEEGSLAMAWPGGTRPAQGGKHNGCRELFGCAFSKRRQVPTIAIVQASRTPCRLNERMMCEPGIASSIEGVCSRDLCYPHIL
ncbi:uncharacterized protein ZBAI_02635 [Zygosaccharomyces bailii ISA1307]|nr:uncharacterized protein ZBAI_02635 [Zygosaccharomyces bailii ISA1307]